ncbi:hypothetical protein A5821_002644 [Enterococcus sp. 7F3_DIV0205]|uniref:LXG domain-containing protein n=1 Tax=Candidatus Enterococcus palustris TaxID=1834189 RepID=A0AAQ3WBD7_9ENTE
MSSIDMYLSSANSQATGVSALSNKHHNGYNQLEKALQQFVGDSVLKSDSYDSAKAFYSAVLIPLAQGGILLTDAVEEACKKFPEQYTTDVDSGDLKSEELEKEIEELENNITRVQNLQRELRHFPVPSPVKQLLMHQNQQSLTRDLEAKQELEKKLQKLQAFHASSPTIFSEISGLKATIDQGIAQANQSWNASTGQFTIPSGKNMDWANTIKNSWATRDKRLMEKQLKEYQIYAMIYKDKDGKPKIIWKVTKDGAGVKNPKIYQYLNANGKEIPSDLFEFISQQDWDDRVKAAFRNGKDLQIGNKYNPVLGALVASGQYLEDGYKFMTEDELGQALQMLGFNFASYRLATNKGTKTVENKKAGGANVPQNYLDEALKQQGLDTVPKNLKQKWSQDGYNYEVRVHPGNSAHTDAESIYRVSRKATPVAGKQGSGMEYMDVDGNWWHESKLKAFHKGGQSNPNFNHKAAKDTHIPVGK